MSTTIKVIVVAVVLAGAIGVIAMKQSGSDTSPQTQPVTTVQKDAPAESAVAPADVASLPRLIDLGSINCIPCKAMAPILEALGRDFADQIEVTFIDVWQDKAAGEAYGIRLIPTQIFFDAQGNELFRHEGFYSREEILAKWDELGIELRLPAVTEAGT